jgi:sodium-dependent dicarboxylate transporter 2/3/5
MTKLQRIGLFTGPVLGLATALILRFAVPDMPAAAAWCAGVTVWTAAWWITEPIAIAATSLIPFFAFPLLNVVPAKTVANALGDDLILLFMGGFMLSAAMEKAGAHRRLAMGMVHAIGGRGGAWLVLGFMVAGASLSMWISNTATALVMLPVVLAVLEQTDDKRLAAPLLLGIAYSTSIGGMGTPIGTPPNLVFIKHYEMATAAMSPDGVGYRVNFYEWMKIGVPVVVVLLPLAWLYLSRPLFGAAQRVRLPQLGAWRSEEVRVLIVFTITALAWITRATPGEGWSGLIGAPGVSDGTVALAAVLVMFVVPNGKGEFLLDWNTAVKIPWGILLLFAGGIAIAAAFEGSGLSKILGEAIADVADWPVILMILAVCLAVTFFTEVTSNTATTNLLMPVLAAAAAVAMIDPVLLMVPAALSASCAFMLPVATPPNAIVFGSGRFTLLEMARRGLALNFIGAAVITTLCWLLLQAWSPTG